MKNSLVFENDAPVLAKDASSKDDDWFVIAITTIIITIIIIISTEVEQFWWKGAALEMDLSPKRGSCPCSV